MNPRRPVVVFEQPGCGDALDLLEFHLLELSGFRTNGNWVVAECGNEIETTCGAIVPRACSDLQKRGFTGCATSFQRVRIQSTEAAVHKVEALVFRCD